MLIADIKGKLSLSEWVSEDFLTSSVFSFFRYVHPKWLVRYLNLAVDKENNNILDIAEDVPVDYEFWPWFSTPATGVNGAEPDLVVYLGNLAVLIEAKNFAGKSGEGVEEDESGTKFVRDQLAREYFVGKMKLLDTSRYARCVREFKIIYLTRHTIVPVRDIVKSIRIIEQCDPSEQKQAGDRILWLNWQRVHSVLEQFITDEEESQYVKLMAQDLIKFLTERDLNFFGGFKGIAGLNIANYSNLFYTKKWIPYWKHIELINLFFYRGFYKKFSQPYWRKILGYYFAGVHSIFYRGDKHV